MIASVTNKAVIEIQLFGQVISLLRYCPLKNVFFVFYISFLLFPALLAWLVNNCLFGLISHRTLGISVLRRKFPVCVAPSWCYFQGTVCRLQQIGLDGFFFYLSSVRTTWKTSAQWFCDELWSPAQKWMGYICAHVFAQRRIWGKLWRFFVLTCFTTDVLTWLLNSTAEGGQRAKTELRKT